MDAIIKIFKQLLLLPFTYYKNRSTGEIINRFEEKYQIIKGVLE